MHLAMVQGASHGRALSCQHVSKKRRVGQTASPLSYGHLLQSLPQEQKIRPQNPEIDALPIESSDESHFEEDALSEVSAPSSKRGKDAGHGIDILDDGKRTADEEQGQCMELSRIKSTIFKTSERRQGNFENAQLSSRERPLEEDLFAPFSSSQTRRVKRCYGGSANLHTSIAKKIPAIKSSKMARKTVTTQGGQVYRTCESGDIDAAPVEKNRTKADPAWKDPTTVYGPPQRQHRATRQSTRNASLTTQVPLPIFQEPADVPSLPQRTRKALPFSKSLNDSSAPVFRMPFDNFSSGLEQSTLSAEAGQARQSSTITPSIKASSSLPSISNDTGSPISLLSSPPSSPTHLPSLSSTVLNEFPKETYTTCPVCSFPVPTNLLSEYLAQRRYPRLTLKHQARFCRSHRKITALETWNQRDYPVIDWANLNSRLKNHHPHIQCVIDGKVASCHRARMEESVKSGKNRTLIQAMMKGGIDVHEKPTAATDISAGPTDTTPFAGAGYYGPRGRSLIQTHLITCFSRSLRKLASTDRMVAAGGGAAGFVQFVLVPEMVERLVIEDLKEGKERDVVALEKARRIIEESGKLGELVWEEEDEFVRESDDEEGKEFVENGYEDRGAR